MHSRGLQRTSRLPVAIFLTMALAAFAGAAEPDTGLPPDAVAVLYLEQPLRVLDHPLVESIWQELRQSDAIQRSLTSANAEPLQQLRQFIVQATGVDWRAGLAKLTAGGVSVAVSPGPPPRVTAIFTADSEDAWTRVITMAQELMRARAPKRDAVASRNHRGRIGYQAGELYYGTVGARLVAANHADDWRETVDRLLDQNEDSPSSAGIAGSRIASLSVNLAVIRQMPKLTPYLTFPSNRADVVTLWGGWINLLRRGDRLAADLHLTARGLELQMRVENLSGSITPGLAGYFASPGDALVASTRAAPLLKVPDMIYSASWFRDYKSMWDGRATLLDDATRTRLEKSDADLATQFSVVRVKDAARTSEIVSQMGPHLRLVVSRQSEPVYRVKMADRLPNAALVVDLLDEGAFRTRLEPILRGISLIFTFQSPGMRPKEITHRGAKLVSLVFPDDPVSENTGNHVRFNFSPTYAITRGHLIFGSTPEIVRNCIDELDHQSSASLPQELPPGTTDLQFLSMEQASRALQDYSESIVRSVVMNQGLAIAKAQQELGVLTRALTKIGEVALEMHNSREAFQFSLTLATAESGGKE